MALKSVPAFIAVTDVGEGTRWHKMLLALSLDGQLASWTALHEFRSACVVSNLNSQGINDCQKVCDLLSEPESPSNIRKFSYPITAICWPCGNQRADCLQALFDLVSLIIVEYKKLRDEFPRHCVDS